MRLGVGVPISGPWATPGNLVRLVGLAEDLGYHSAWTLQRLLVPAQPDERSGDVAYRRILDPVIPLAFLAGQTRRIRLGTAVVNAPFISPAVLAKQLTSVDILSDGRLDVGLGAGWSPVEFTATGMPMARRGARLEEFVHVLRALWTQDVIAHKGEFYEVPAARAEPKPVQRPHPPILLGGTAEAAVRRAGRIADGWISSSRHDHTRIGETISMIRQAAEGAGRDPDALRLVVRAALRIRPAGQPDRRTFTGSVEEVRADLDMVAAAGITETFLDLNYDDRIAAPDADPQAAMDRAEETLRALVPGTPGS